MAVATKEITAYKPFKFTARDLPELVRQLNRFSREMSRHLHVQKLTAKEVVDLTDDLG